MTRVRPHTKSQLKPGLMFSPGFYMGYWEHVILRDFTYLQIMKSNKLTKHREMWVGAIMAAAQTRATGRKFFVGLPDDEPADIEMSELLPASTPSGKAGTRMERTGVQITRCNYDDAETLITQIDKKNKPGYSGYILAVHAYGNKTTPDYADTIKKLNALEAIYPSEIVVVEIAERTPTGIIMPPKTYSITKLYPSTGQTLVNIDDGKVFFRNPEVFSKTIRGASTEWDDLGSFELMPPSI